VRGGIQGAESGERELSSLFLVFILLLIAIS
jgi:hypothetical protein